MAYKSYKNNTLEVKNFGGKNIVLKRVLRNNISPIIASYNKKLIPNFGNLGWNYLKGIGN